MIDRQKLLVWSVVATAGLLAVDRFYVSPWLERLRKADTEIARVTQQLTLARAAVGNRAAIMNDWKALHARLSRERESDTLNDFVSGLQALSGLVGLQNWSVKPEREHKIGERGEFTEYVVVTSFHTTWESYVRLLLEVQNWKDFIKVHKLTVGSRYEKENRLDVELRVSTIELSPRAGGRP